MPGPTPKPKRLKKLLGNPGHQKLDATVEPTPLHGHPECPKRLKGAARCAWLHLSAQIAAMNLDFQIDSLALEGACVAYGRAVDADAVIDANGPTFTTPNGYVQQRPEVSIALQGWKLFSRFCSEFGFTPAARTRLSIVPARKEANPWAEFEEQYPVSKPRTPRPGAN
jgi:P27 family predicted phage terminase small subunit